jgi:hypothetical protein
MGTALSVRIDHVAECPEISPPDCKATVIPAHMHRQRLDWFRANTDFNVGLGRGVQLGLSVPFDVRVLGIEYSLLDGEPYDPPYGDIHHRDETLWGPVDGTLQVQAFRTLGESSWTVGASLGTSLPWGRTHPDPFLLGAMGKRHQHFQFGTGTLVPLGDVQVVLAGRLGGNAWLQARVPLYANGREYFPGSTVGWGVGPRYMVAAPYTVALTAEGVHQSTDSWRGYPSPSSGRDALMVALANNVRVSGHTSLYARALTTVWQQSRSKVDEDQFLQRFVGTIGVVLQ